MFRGSFFEAHFLIKQNVWLTTNSCYWKPLHRKPYITKELLIRLLWEIRRFFPTSIFRPSVVFHIETSHLFCSAKQMTGFYMKRNTGLKWVKRFQVIFGKGQLHGQNETAVIIFFEKFRVYSATLFL